MENKPQFEIVNETGPVIKIVGDDGVTTEVTPEVTPEVVNPRYKYIGEYNVSNHPNYKPSSMFRDMKWLLAYDKQVAKYPKVFKPRAS